MAGHVHTYYNIDTNEVGMQPIDWINSLSGQEKDSALALWNEHTSRAEIELDVEPTEEFKAMFATYMAACNVRDVVTDAQ